MTAIKAVFFDRDGVIVEDGEYLFRPSDLVLIPETAEVIAWLNTLGVKVFCITNQSGIGRGYYTVADYETARDFIGRELKTRFGARIDVELFASCGPNLAQGSDGEPDVGIVPMSDDSQVLMTTYDHSHPFFRKPSPGMLLKIFSDTGLSPKESILIGNSPTDMEAGVRAKLWANIGFEMRASAIQNGFAVGGQAQSWSLKGDFPETPGSGDLGSIMYFEVKRQGLKSLLDQLL